MHYQAWNGLLIPLSLPIQPCRQVTTLSTVLAYALASLLPSLKKWQNLYSLEAFKKINTINRQLVKLLITFFLPLDGIDSEWGVTFDYDPLDLVPCLQTFNPCQRESINSNGSEILNSSTILCDLYWVAVGYSIPLPSHHHYF